MRGEITKFDLSPFKNLDCRHHNAANGVFGDEDRVWHRRDDEHHRVSSLQYGSATKRLTRASTIICSSSSSSSSSLSYDHNNHLHSKCHWNVAPPRTSVQQTAATRRPNSILFVPAAEESHELDQSKRPGSRNNCGIPNGTLPRRKRRIKRPKRSGDEKEAKDCGIYSVTHQNRRDNRQLQVALDHSQRHNQKIQSDHAGPRTVPKRRHSTNNDGSNSNWTNETTLEPPSNENNEVAAAAAQHHPTPAHRSHLLQCDDVITEYHNLSLQQQHAAPCLKAANSITSTHKDTTSGSGSGKSLLLLSSSSSRLDSAALHDSKHSAATTMPSSSSFEKKPSATESNCGRESQRNLRESNSMAMAALNLGPASLPPPAAAAAAVAAVQTPLSIVEPKTTMMTQQAAASSSSSSSQKHDCCCCPITRCVCSHDEDIDSEISRKGSITSQRRNVGTTESNSDISSGSNQSTRKKKLPSLRNFSMFKSRLRGLCVRLTDFKHHTTNVVTTAANCNTQSSCQQHTCNCAKSADNDLHCFAPTSRCVGKPLMHEDMPNIDIYEPAINNVESTGNKQRAFPSYSFDSRMHADDINKCANFCNYQFSRKDQIIEQEAAPISPALDANTYRHSDLFITDNNLSNFLNQQLQSINLNESDNALNADDPSAAAAAMISDSAMVSTSSSSDPLPKTSAVPVPNIESQDLVPVLTSPDRALLTHFMEIFERIMSKMVSFETFIPSEIEDIACHLLRLCASVGNMRLIGHAIIAQELNFYDGEALNDSILSYLKSIRDAFYSILLLRQENVDSYYFCINGFDITYLVASKFNTMFIFVLQQCKDFTSLDEMCDSEQIVQSSLAS